MNPSRCMRRTLPMMLALGIAAFGGSAPARAADVAIEKNFQLGDDVSEYKHFLVYPHLQKAFAAQADGDLITALREFTRSRELLPENTLTAVYLAEAHRRSGQPARAESVLREQLRHTPGDTRVIAALQALAASQQPVTPVAPATVDPVAQLRSQAQQSIHRRDWPAADRALAELERRTTLTAEERGQWFNLLLALGRLDAAQSLQQRAGLNSPRQQLAWAQALAAKDDRSALAAWVAGRAPAFSSAADERQWIVLLEKAAAGGTGSAGTDVVVDYTPRHAANRGYHAAIAVPELVARNDREGLRLLLDRLPEDGQREARYTLALIDGRLDDAAAQLQAIWQRDRDAAVLDALSFRLREAGADAQVGALLLAAWPFDDNNDRLRSSEAQRSDDASERPVMSPRVALAQRLAAVLAGHPDRVTAADRARLQSSLATRPDTPAERGARAAVFSALQDCAAVRSLLADFSVDYGRDDWLRLGDCYHAGALPGLAQHAYREAWHRQRDGLTARALAYQSFAVHDYTTALNAWHAVAVETMNPTEARAAATTALAARDQLLARIWLERYVTAGGARDDGYWSLRAQVETEPSLAMVALGNAIALRPDPQYYARLATLQRAAGLPATAALTMEKAVALEPGNDELALSLAYAQSAAGRPTAARAGFEAALAADPGNEALLQQLVWTSRQQGDIDAARRYAERAIDALGDADDDTGKEARYAFRRLHEELGRRWTFSADVSSGTRVAAVASAPDPGSAWRSYSQLEAQYRLGDAAMRADNRLAATARVFAGGGADNEALPVYAPVLGIGLRVRPWIAQSIFLAAEHQQPLDNAAGASGPDPDFLLRASASFLGNDRYSDEWHVAGRGWPTQSLYLELAQYAASGRTAATADYRRGWHHKIAAGQTLEPFARVQANRIDDIAAEDDLRAGVGLRWHILFSEATYDAWRHHAQIGIEFQHAFDTWLRESDAVFFTAGVRW